MTKQPRPAAIALSVLATACLLAWGTAGPHVGTRASGTNGFVQTLSGTGWRNDASTLDKPYVILVGFDGFGHDYVDRFETPNFDRIAAAGAKADALIPVFPSLTFPSFYSIATGMYPRAPWHRGQPGLRPRPRRDLLLPGARDRTRRALVRRPAHLGDGRKLREWWPRRISFRERKRTFKACGPRSGPPTIARSPIKRGSIRCSPGWSSRLARGPT